MTTPRSMVRCKFPRDGTAAKRFVSRILLCASLLACAVLAGARAAGTSPGADDRSLSAGCWDVVAVEWDGSPVDQELLSRLQVVFQADGSWVVLLRRIPVAEGTSTHRQDASPKTFEMATLGSEGIEPSRYKGIYRLDGDTREFCIVPDGKPRPDEFSAPMHSDRVLVTLKRAQKPSVRE